MNLQYPTPSRPGGLSYVLSTKQSSKTSNFNVFCLTQLEIKLPSSRMPGKSSGTTLPNLDAVYYCIEEI